MIAFPGRQTRRRQSKLSYWDQIRIVGYWSGYSFDLGHGQHLTFFSTRGRYAHYFVTSRAGGYQGACPLRTAVEAIQGNDRQALRRLRPEI